LKILSFPAAKGEPESLSALAVMTEGVHLLVHSGKRYLNMKPSDWKEFAGNRASRGGRLPRGYQNVGALEVS
jgi:topoisomerase-4 subunit A